MKMLAEYGLVALGGSLGAMMRYWLGNVITRRFGTYFPYGTFVINVTGSFIIGLFLTLVTERIPAPLYWRLLFSVGFLGAYTTFSTFEYETIKAMEEGRGLIGILYVIASVVVGYILVWLGVMIARKW
jgi:CrcB protein